MRKTLSILFVLALVLSFSVVATTPVAAATINVPGDYATIQAAVDAASSGDTIVVAAGTYFGATVSKAVTIQAKTGDTVIINDGPNTHTFLRAGFYFASDYSGNGATISGFDIQGAIQAGTTDDGKLDFAVFSRGANNVEIEGNTICDMLQGITNWHGNGWQINDNEITDLWTLNGGGVGILVGANDGSTVAGNVISGNKISGTLSVYSGDGGGYDGSGIVLYADFRWSPGGIVTDSLVKGNEISMTSDTPATVNFNGIELVDTRDSDANPSAVLNNQVICNSVHNNSRIGIYVSAGTSGNGVNFNSIFANMEHGVRYDGTGTLDAENNWWGDDSGPSGNGPGTGDAVSANVDYDPWIKKSVPDTATGTGPVSFSSSVGNILGLTPVTAPGLPSVSFPHGMFSFQICCLDPGESVVVTVILPSAVPVGTVWWKYDNGRWSSLPNLNDNGDNIMKIRLTDGGAGDSDSIPGQITDPGGPGNPMTVGWDGSPISKSGVLWPWIALLTAIVVGVALLVPRHRRAER